MRIPCLAEDSEEISSLIFSKKQRKIFKTVIGTLKELIKVGSHKWTEEADDTPVTAGTCFDHHWI